MARRNRVFAALIIVALIALVGTGTSGDAQGGRHWPTQGWTYATPESQGMDSSALAALIAGLPAQDQVDSFTIIRNGYVVADVYWQPFSPEMDHHWYSVSKSVTSALVGIAIEGGYLENLDQRVVDYFPEYQIANRDADKQAMTLRDLLTMRSGFACDITQGSDPYAELPAAADSIQFGLDFKMAGKPGQVFRYCDINTYLLAAILTRMTGMSLEAFARTHLFGPLGIREFRWVESRQGIDLGFMGLFMKPLDMAKIGYLYLSQGVWDGRQIIPKAWVEESTAPSVWLGRMDGYGYQWWLHPTRYGPIYTAEGSQDQYVAIQPDKGLVVVMTASAELGQRSLPIARLMEAVLDTIRGDGPLPDNPGGVAALAAVSEAASSPAPQAISMFPALESAVAGRRFVLDAPWAMIPDNYTLRAVNTIQHVPDVSAFRFSFAGDTAALTLYLTDGDHLIIPVGLDETYRTTAYDGTWLAAKGKWFANFGSFNLTLRLPTTGYWGNLRFTFPEDRLVCSVQTNIGTWDTLRGKAAE